MAKKQLVSIWNVIESNENGETKVLSVKSGNTKHHIVVFTSPAGFTTSAVVSGEVEFTKGEIKELPVGEPS